MPPEPENHGPEPRDPTKPDPRVVQVLAVLSALVLIGLFVKVVSNQQKYEYSGPTGEYPTGVIRACREQFDVDWKKALPTYTFDWVSNDLPMAIQKGPLVARFVLYHQRSWRLSCPVRLNEDGVWVADRTTLERGDGPGYEPYDGAPLPPEPTPAPSAPAPAASPSNAISSADERDMRTACSYGLDRFFQGVDYDLGWPRPVKPTTPGRAVLYYTYEATIGGTEREGGIICDFERSGSSWNLAGVRPVNL